MEELYSLVMNNYVIQEYYNYNGLHNELNKDGEGNEIFSNGWRFKKSSSTEEEYVKNYGNPSCSVTHFRHKIILAKDDRKISLKIFVYHRSRNVGKKFFRTLTSLQFLTFNYVTNILYTGFFKDYHKKRKKQMFVRRASIYNNPLNRFRMILNNIFNYSLSNILEKGDIISNIFNLYCSHIPGTEKYDGISTDMKIYKRIYDYDGVKLPDNWMNFIFLYPQPNKKILRKNGFKYIDSIMSMYELKGDKIRKILHNVKDFKYDMVKLAFNLFGKDFILSQKDEDIFKIFETDTYLSNTNNNLEFISKKEKQNAYEVFKLVLNKEISVYTFSDHIRFLIFLRPLEEIRWASKTYQEFIEEHYIWSEKQGFYTKGDFTRTYNSKFIDKIQQNIIYKGEVYYPVVLLKSQDYNKESYVQSNCVKTYVDKASSMIVSLRKGQPDSEDRVTIEYKVLKDGDYYGFKRIQTLGKYNCNISNEWLNVVNEIDCRLVMMDVKRSFTLPTISVIFGNRMVKSGSKFIEKSKMFGEELEWENDDIRNTNIVAYDIIDGFDNDFNFE